MSVFTIIKQNITAADIADNYSIKKSGKLYQCPFHNDNTPSMQVDERYYCHGCGATGDAVDLAARIFNIRPIEAAEKIIADFGLDISGNAAPKKTSKINSLRDDENKAIEKLIEYEKLLKMLLSVFAPKPDDEKMSQAFLFIQNTLAKIDDILYHIYQNPTEEELKFLIKISNKITEEPNDKQYYPILDGR